MYSSYKMQTAAACNQGLVNKPSREVKCKVTTHISESLNSTMIIFKEEK